MSTRMVRTGPERSTIVAWAVAAVLAVALVVTLVVGRGGDESSARDGALEAARSAAVALTSYDHATLDRDVAWVDEGGTASFAKEYRAANEPLGKVITRLEAHSVGKVVDAAATVKDPTHVDVLLFVDQTITNGSDDERKVERTRVVLSMVERDDAWLVDDVTLR